jgi:hypothetical protein
MSTHNDFEAISAYLDGEATTDEVTRIEGSPELLAQVAELRSLALLGSAPVSFPSEAVRDSAIAAALAVSATAPNVTSLTAAKAQRSRVAMRWASVAAAVAVVMLAVPFVFSGSDSSDSFSIASDITADSGDSAADAEIAGSIAADSTSDESGGALESAPAATEALVDARAESNEDPATDLSLEFPEDEVYTAESVAEEPPSEITFDNGVTGDDQGNSGVVGRHIMLDQLTKTDVADDVVAQLLFDAPDKSDNTAPEPIPCSSALGPISESVVFTIVADRNVLILVQTVEGIPVYTALSLTDCVVITDAEPLL